MALLESARAFTDELLCVVPRAYPHKEFEGATFEDRLEMLRDAGAGFEVAATEGGLFIEIARELLRERSGAEIHFICGADAAERVLTWDYGVPGAVEAHLREYGILMAERERIYTPPEHLAHHVRAIPLDARFQPISSSEVRRRVAAGEPWEHLVPGAIVDQVRRIYAARPSAPMANQPQARRGA